MLVGYDAVESESECFPAEIIEHSLLFKMAIGDQWIHLN